MIYLGLNNQEKLEKIAEYNAKKLVIVSADKFQLNIENEITYSQAIEYVHFYRLLQEIDHNTLVVINECLRTQNRYDLTYNCIRHYLNQTNHQIIFQKFPFIDNYEDFMILFDFDTKSRWKRKKFDIDLIKQESLPTVKKHPVKFNKISLFVSDKTKDLYKKKRNKLFENIGLKDPHTIPRNLYLISGKEKKQYCIHQSQPSLFSNTYNNAYLARNKRLNTNYIFSYRDKIQALNYTILEFPHRFIDFLDFLQQTDQTNFDVVVADLKIDDWYFNKYSNWSKRINELYADLQ